MRMFLVWKRRCANVRAGTQAPPLRSRLGGLRMDGWFRLGGLCANGYFVCMGLCGKILRSLVGAVPVCPPVSPHKGASIVHPHAQCAYFWYGNAATRTFGRARRHRPYGFVWMLRVDVAPTISNIIFLCVTVLTEDKKISKHTYIRLRDCYIIAHRNNWYD